MIQDDEVIHPIVLNDATVPLFKNVNVRAQLIPDYSN